MVLLYLSGAWGGCWKWGTSMREGTPAARAVGPSFLIHCLPSLLLTCTSLQTVSSQQLVHWGLGRKRVNTV